MVLLMRLISQIQALPGWFAIRCDGTDFAVVQLTKLRRQLPLLYLVLIINMVAVAFTHYGLAPNWLTVAVPLLLGSICAVRAVFWARSSSASFSVAEARGHLRRTTFLAGALSAFFLLWALSLNQYGGPYEQGHVTFFVAITVIGCIFCLMHLPQAAFLVTFIVLFPFLTYYVSTGGAVFIAIAVNLALVALVMVQVCTNNFQAFVDLENSKSALSAEKEQSRALSAENALLASTDGLTGMPNRRVFFAKLNALIEAAGDLESTFAVGVLDLDGFKPINDGFGHATGDRVLVEIGRRLESLPGGNVMAARLGGDEFGIIIIGRGDADLVERYGRDICDALRMPVLIDGLELGCRASCGLAMHTRSAFTAALLYDQADYALYDAKARRRGEAVLFSDKHEAKLLAERAIEAALMTADLDAEMEIYFQPIIDITTNRDVAAEALARWTSSALGPIDPHRFIEVAERTGLIRTLTPVLFRKALKEAAFWPEPLTLSFNLSAHDVMSPETMLSVIAAVRGSGLDPARITLEITETAVMRDFDLARSHIATLRAFGVKVALDDFGAGYSSLSCVHRLPLDKIKIDRSFIQNITGELEGRQVVQSILDLCGTLGLECIVEGVENADQCSLIEKLGGRFIQGYHFARPMSAADFAIRCEVCSHEVQSSYLEGTRMLDAADNC